MAKVIESDVCVIGAGITSAMVAEKLTEEREGRVVVVEAGNKIFNFNERSRHRQRFQDYGENPWPDDHIRGQTALRIQSRTMAVGGQALHWGGTCPRFTREDFQVRSLYGVGYDWPITYDDIEPFYQEAEERIGVAGTQGPSDLDQRSKPYPLPGLPISYNIGLLKEWAEKSGIPFWPNPVSKNTIPYRGRRACQRCDQCSICPSGAKYSPDYTFRDLLDQKRIELIDRTLVRKLVLEDRGDRIAYAVATDRDQPDEPVHLRAKIFVLGAGYVWSAHLLLLSAVARFPDGLANRSGLVGKYVTGHRPVTAYAEVPMKLYPGVFGADSLLSKKFQRPGKLERYMRHDLRIWESTAGRAPRLENDAGEILLGDSVLADWRERTKQGAARMRCYYDVIPARESALTLDPATRNEWGDVMPRIDFVDSEDSLKLREHTETHIRNVFEGIVHAGGGKVLSIRVQNAYDHPGGGCRMGDDRLTSVVDSFGRSHDHENLFVIGAPTIVTGGCANGTLTTSALSLRSAVEIGRELPPKRQ